MLLGKQSIYILNLIAICKNMATRGQTFLADGNTDYNHMLILLLPISQMSVPGPLGPLVLCCCICQRFIRYLAVKIEFANFIILIHLFFRFAFVDFKEEKEALRVIKDLNNTVYRNRDLQCRLGKKKGTATGEVDINCVLFLYYTSAVLILFTSGLQTNYHTIV